MAKLKPGGKDSNVEQGKCATQRVPFSTSQAPDSLSCCLTIIGVVRLGYYVGHADEVLFVMLFEYNK